MTQPMNAVETAAYVRMQQLSQIQMCSHHLQMMNQTDRPADATVDEVREAAMSAHKQLSNTGPDVAEISQTNCPCEELGSECLLQSDPDSGN
jgi:hypothetical protein